MPMAEYIAGYRDFGRVRGYCRECSRYGNCWACPPYDIDETALLEQYTTISLMATVITPSEGVTLTPETADRIIRRERERLDWMLLKMEREAAVPAHTARAFLRRHLPALPAEALHTLRRPTLPPPGEHPPVAGGPGIRHCPHTPPTFSTHPCNGGRNGQPPEYLTLISGFARKNLSIYQKLFVDLHFLI